MLVAPLHELGCSGIAPRTATVAIIVRLPRRMASLSPGAAGLVAVLTSGCVTAIGMRPIGVACGTMITPVLATTLGRAMFTAVIFRTMMVARCVIAAPFTLALAAGFVRTGILIARPGVVAVARTLVVGHAERRAIIDAKSIMRRRAISALGWGSRTVVAALAGAFARWAALAFTTLVLRCRLAMAMLAAPTIAIAFAARTFVTVGMIARQRGKYFAADVLDDFNRLLHHALDGAHFLAF